MDLSFYQVVKTESWVNVTALLFSQEDPVGLINEAAFQKAMAFEFGNSRFDLPPDFGKRLICAEANAEADGQQAKRHQTRGMCPNKSI